MKFRLQNEVISTIPGLQIGLIVLKNLKNMRKNSTVEQLLRGLAAEKKRELKDDKKKSQLENLLSKAHLSSKILAEAQFLEESIKTVTGGKDFPFKSNVEALRLYVGLRNGFPSGLYDLDQLEKDQEILFVEPKTKTSLKQNVQSETVNAVMWFINLGTVLREDFEGVINESAKMIQKFSQAQEMNIHFLSSEINEVDLEYVSEKEKTYLEEQQKLAQQKKEEEERKQEEARIAAEKEAERKRIEEEQEAEKKRQEEEKIAQQKLEDEKREAERKLEEEKMAAEKKQQEEIEKQRLAEEEKKIQEQETVKKLREKENNVPAEEKVTTAIASKKVYPMIHNDNSTRSQLQKILNETVELYLKKTAEDLTIHEPARIMLPSQKGHGDFVSNIAMQLGKKLNKNPQDVAKEIMVLLPAIDFVEKIELAGPGFINFTLSQKYLEREIENVLIQKEKYGSSQLGQNQKIMIEYSQPNIAKPLGAHHLLSTVIGQILVNLYRFEGFEVIATNYPGDWGTQFGKLIYAYKTWGNEQTIKQDPLNELLKLYVHFHDEAEKDSTLDEKGRAEFKKLEDGNEENYKLWKWIKDLSIQEVERLYRKLDVKFDLYLGEEMHRFQAKKLIDEGLAKGIIEVGEKGALIVKFDDDTLPPYIVQKADGTTIYSSRDLGSIQYRLETFHPQKLVYVVDVAQSLHFQQLFETAQKYEFNDAELVHVHFGRMQFPDGKMSTRKGEIILLDEMIKEAEERSQKIIDEKSRDLTTEEKKVIAQAMAISAIKYNILCQNRESNYTFQWDKILSLEGNSAPYLQYAYARAQNILKKATTQSEQPKAEELLAEKQKQPTAGGLFQKNTPVQTSLLSMEPENDSAENVPEINNAEAPLSTEILEPFQHPTEQKLLHLFPLFSEYLEQATLEYKPNVLCTYLFELARAFSGFYSEVQVVNAPTEELKASRLKLVEAFGQILENGLHLLGIATFKKM